MKIGYVKDNFKYFSSYTANCFSAQHSFIIYVLKLFACIITHLTLNEWWIAEISIIKIARAHIYKESADLKLKIW